MASDVTYRGEAMCPVYSRISWGAIFAGAFVAFAIYFLLNLLGAAVGLSVGDEELGTGAAIWAIAVVLIALFVGGMVTTRCTVGENRTEGIVYGAVLWGVLFAGLMLLLTTGISMGFGALITLSNAGRAGVTNQERLERLGQATGISAPLSNPETSQPRGNNPQAPARNGNNVRTMDDDAIRAATWWAFGGTLLSMLAAIAGAVLGAATCGYSFRVTRVDTRRGYAGTAP